MMVKHLPKQYADNGAILTGAIVELLVIFKVHEKLELTVKEVVAAVGAALIIGGAIRSIWRSMRASKAENAG
jgi:branched-subunit amino acid ABC-type transport system permease component